MLEQFGLNLNINPVCPGPKLVRISTDGWSRGLPLAQLNWEAGIVFLWSLSSSLWPYSQQMAAQL